MNDVLRALAVIGLACIGAAATVLTFYFLAPVIGFYAILVAGAVMTSPLWMTKLPGGIVDFFSAIADCFNYLFSRCKSQRSSVEYSPALTPKFSKQRDVKVNNPHNDRRLITGETHTQIHQSTNITITQQSTRQIPPKQPTPSSPSINSVDLVQESILRFG